MPCKESGLEENIAGKFGQWLKAEVCELRPLRKLFYGKELPIIGNEETVVETSIHQQYMIVTRQQGDPFKIFYV